jgi:hypothetical protein
MIKISLPFIKEEDVLKLSKEEFKTLFLRWASEFGWDIAMSYGYEYESRKPKINLQQIIKILADEDPKPFNLSFNNVQKYFRNTKPKINTENTLKMMFNTFQIKQEYESQRLNMLLYCNKYQWRKHLLENEESYKTIKDYLILKWSNSKTFTTWARKNTQDAFSLMRLFPITTNWLSPGVLKKNPHIQKIMLAIHAADKSNTQITVDHAWKAKEWSIQGKRWEIAEKWKLPKQKCHPITGSFLTPKGPVTKKGDYILANNKVCGRFFNSEIFFSTGETTALAQSAITHIKSKGINIYALQRLCSNQSFEKIKNTDTSIDQFLLHALVCCAKANANISWALWEIILQNLNEEQKKTIIPHLNTLARNEILQNELHIPKYEGLKNIIKHLDITDLNLTPESLIELI